MAVPHAQIRLDAGAIKICSFYRFPGKKCTGKCGSLHICPSYLAGFCHFQGSCILSHSFLERHNLDILRGINPFFNRITCNENIREIVINAFPKVCSHYNTVNGCSSGNKCRFLHICGKLVNDCCKGNNCVLNHDHTSVHEKNILSKYDINTHSERNFKLLYANVLYAEGSVSRKVQRCSCLRDIPGCNLSRASSVATLDGDDDDNESEIPSFESQNQSGQGRIKRGGRGRGRGRGGGRYQHGYRGANNNDRGRVRRDSASSHSSKSNIYVSESESDEDGSDDIENRLYLKQFQQLLWSQGGKIRFLDLLCNRAFLNIFPNRFNIKQWLLKNESHLVLGFRAGDKLEEISLLLNVNICYWYNTDMGCRYGDQCQSGLHVCKKFIENSCDRKCSKAHNFHERPSLNIIQGKLDLPLRKTEVMLSAVAASMPQICHSWNKDNGRCPRGMLCSHLHLCQEFLMKTCKRKQCPIGHNWRMKQCMDVFKKFGYNDMTVDRLNDILFVHLAQDPVNKAEKCVENVTNGNFHFRDILRQHLYKLGGGASFEDLCKTDIPSKCPDGAHKFGGWLQHHSGDFLCYFDNKGERIVDVKCLLQLRICYSYNTSGCSNECCEYLHLCSEYISQACKQNKCNKNHHFNDASLKNFMKKYSVPKLKNDILRSIFAGCLPQICENFVRYNGDCVNRCFCRKLHICPNLIYARCEKSTCDKSHNVKSIPVQRILRSYGFDNFTLNCLKMVILPPSLGEYTISIPKAAVTDVQDKKISRYESGEGKVAKERYRKNRRKNKKTSSVESAGAFKSDSNQGVISLPGRSNTGEDNIVDDEVVELCEAFVRRDCDKDNYCTNIHRSLPYQWQYKRDDGWNDFPTDMNISIEQSFSNPDNTSWVKQQIASNITKRDDFRLKGDIMIQFSSSQVCHAGGYSDVRRLSTLSDASAEEDEAFATRWRWYYHIDDKWYGGDDNSVEKCDITMQVELAFLEGKDDFNIDEFGVKLNLQNMEAANIATGEEIPLQRRPIFVDESSVRKYEPRPSPKVKQTNPQERFISKNDPTYLQIYQLLRDGMPHMEVTIFSIQSVSNMNSRADFLRCKDRLQNHPSGNRLKERMLFYSCDFELQDYVSQNGPVSRSVNEKSNKHLKDLGEGFYFTKEILENEFFTERPYFIFVANVLISNIKNGAATGDPYELATIDTFCNSDGNIFMKMEKAHTLVEYLVHYDATVKIAPNKNASKVTVSPQSPYADKGSVELRNYSPPPEYSKFNYIPIEDYERDTIRAFESATITSYPSMPSQNAPPYTPSVQYFPKKSDDESKQIRRSSQPSNYTSTLSNHNASLTHRPPVANASRDNARPLKYPAPLLPSTQARSIHERSSYNMSGQNNLNLQPRIDARPKTVPTNAYVHDNVPNFVPPEIKYPYKNTTRKDQCILQ